MSGDRKLCESENATLDVSTMMWDETAQSVYRLFTGWTVRGSIPCGERYSAPIQTAPGAHPASYTTGTGSFPGVERLGRGVNHPPHLEPRLKKE